MTEAHPPNGLITFTVKELLARQDTKLDTIILTLGSKADRLDTERINARLDSLERGEARQQGSTGYARWAIPVLLSLLAVGVAVAALVR